MKPFDTLVDPCQLQRLRQVGLFALVAYGAPELRLIRHTIHYANDTQQDVS